MLSRIVGPALRISTLPAVTSLTRGQIQPCLRRRIAPSRAKRLYTAKCDIYPAARCTYYTTKQNEGRDPQKADVDIEEELVQLQNNSSKKYDHTNNIVEFIQRASKLQRLDLALKAFDLGKSTKETSIYNALIRAYAYDGAADEAEQIFSSMTRDNIAIDAHTHAALIFAYGKTNNESALYQYLQRVSEGEVPREEPIYTALMAAYVALRDMETAEKLFDALRQHELVPSVRTFEVLVQGYAQLNSLDLAAKTLRGMERYQLQPSALLLRTLLTACARLGDVSLARTVFSALQRSGVKVDAELWSEMIKIYCHAALVDEAERALNAMRAQGMTPSTAAHAEYMTTLIRADQFARAEAYFNGIRGDTPLNNRIWGRAIETSVKLKKLDQALALVDECGAKQVTLESRVRNLLWNYCKKQQRVEDYLKRFEKVPGNVSLETLQKEGALKMSPWTKMRIESLESDASLPAELKQGKFNPKDWEIVDDPFSARAAPPKAERDETATKLDAIEQQLVARFESLAASMHVEKQKSKAELNREAFKHLDQLQVFDLSSFDVAALKELNTTDIERDIEDFNLTPKTDKRAKKKESLIAGKLEQRIMDLLSKQRVDKLTPVMNAQIKFAADTKQLDPSEEDELDEDTLAALSEDKKVKKTKGKTSGVKLKTKSKKVKAAPSKSKAPLKKSKKISKK